MQDKPRDEKAALLVAKRQALEAALCDLETYSELLMGRLAVTRFLIEELLA